MIRRRAVRVSVFAGLAPVVALVACQVVGGIDTISYGGDATVQPVDDGGDASVPPDAFSCANLRQKPTFCRDFDDDSSFSEGFAVHGTGVTGADSVLASSQPKSFFATLTANGGSPMAYMDRVFEAGQELHLELDVALPGEPLERASVVKLYDGDHGHNLQFFARPGSAWVGQTFPKDAGDGATDDDLGTLITDQINFEQWKHVVIDFRFEKNYATVQVFDQITGERHQAIVRIVGQWKPGPQTLQLGLMYVTNKAGQTWTVREDNILVNIDPP